ncbi:hypothetical protein BJ170DRAFT_630575 [Xylariales sp. AK1849]|nr:hypothetical protein BJ170DRAFT_630575 [Xylariales sp. AK1849]
MAVPTSTLTCGFCGFCGFVSPLFNAALDAWAPYYRAVYSIGPGPSAAPQLSGVGFHRHEQAENYVPALPYQRYDTPHLNGAHLIQIRDIKPPGPGVPPEEAVDYAWGFLFHEACWGVLEQAARPGEVDIGALWRILYSVPCGSELPNWGHNYGGLYMGTMKDQARGEHFVLLGRNSNLVIPSTFANPYRVPELESLVRGMRIKSEAEKEESGTVEGDESPQDVRESTPEGEDPFAVLPMEMKQMLLCYLDSTDTANLRFSSRAFAVTPLTQSFFRSRFWPGREMQVFFDAFLLPDREQRGTDWMRLYWQLKIRLKYNRVCLGERNRLRIWNQTVKPLVRAMGQVVEMSELRGGPEWVWNNEAAESEMDWKIVRTSRSQAPLAFGEIGRVVYRAEVELPARQVRGVNVSFVMFFGTKYITGLRFVFGDGNDVALGYILKRSEEYLAVYDSLMGFHCAVDECGFRALALITGQHMVSEYLEWVGNEESLTSAPLKSATKGVRKLRAAFDGFRLQALLLL